MEISCRSANSTGRSVSLGSLAVKALLVILFAPLVFGTCGDLFVTETVWITATEVADDAPPSSTTPSIAPVVPPSTTAHAPPSTTNGGAQSNSSPVVTIASSQRTTIGAPPSQTGGGQPGTTFNPEPLPAIIKMASPDNFTPLVNQPGQAVIKNSCGYKLLITSVGCGDGVQGHGILPGQIYTEPLRYCPPKDGINGSGTQLQITSETHAKPMLVEYGIDEQDGIFYDLSFLICMKQLSTDMSGCAGWEGGHQCGSTKGCPVFACQPGEYCDRVSYTTHEYGLTEANKAERQSVPAPVGRCQGAKSGIVWEVCAGGSAKKI